MHLPDSSGAWPAMPSLQPYEKFILRPPYTHMLVAKILWGKRQSKHYIKAALATAIHKRMPEICKTINEISPEPIFSPVW